MGASDEWAAGVNPASQEQSRRPARATADERPKKGETGREA